MHNAFQEKPLKKKIEINILFQNNVGKKNILKNHLKISVTSQQKEWGYARQV